MTPLMRPEVHDYHLYGWRLRSPRPLPFLLAAPTDATAPCDVEVHLGPIVAEEAAARHLPHIRVLDDGGILVLPPAGVRMRVDAGRMLTLDLEPGVGDAELRTWLCGLATSALCHQRGRPPLHAAVLDLGGVAVAVAGDCGAGKSTTARALMQRGARLLTDDQAQVDPADGLAYPGFPSIKLWDATARHFDDPTDPKHQVRRGQAKFYLNQIQRFQPNPVPLGAVFVLRIEPALSHPRLERLAPAEATAVLHRFIHRRDMAKALDGGRAAFRWTTAMAERTPVHMLWRPADLNQLDRLCAMIETTTHELIVSIR